MSAPFDTFDDVAMHDVVDFSTDVQGVDALSTQFAVTLADVTTTDLVPLVPRTACPIAAVIEGARSRSSCVFDGILYMCLCCGGAAGMAVPVVAHEDEVESMHAPVVQAAGGGASEDCDMESCPRLSEAPLPSSATAAEPPQWSSYSFLCAAPQAPTAAAPAPLSGGHGDAAGSAAVVQPGVKRLERTASFTDGADGALMASPRSPATVFASSPESPFVKVQPVLGSSPLSSPASTVLLSPQ